VVLVDTTAVNTLFGGENPVGKAIELQGDVFTVVGVSAASFCEGVENAVRTKENRS
jgi:hypothetical protein